MSINLIELLAAKKRAKALSEAPMEEPLEATKPLEEPKPLIQQKVEEVEKLHSSQGYVNAVQDSLKAFKEGIKEESAKPLSLKDKLALLKAAKNPTLHKLAAIELPAVVAQDISRPNEVITKSIKPAPMSLKEKLEAKKALLAEKDLASESAALSSTTKGVDPLALVTDYQEVKIIPKMEELVLAHALQEAPKKDLPTPVIEIQGKFFSITELAYEIERIESLIAKGIKSANLIAKAEDLKGKLIELEVLIDLQQEAMAEKAGKSEAPHVDKVEPSTITASVKEVPLQEHVVEAPKDAIYQGAFSLSIELNERQLMAKEMALTGKSFCLIGAAGTGKTTSQRSVAEALLDSDRLTTCSYKMQGGEGQRVEGPSFVAVAFTRRASANLARAIHKNPKLEEALRHNIMTIHALLEFEPIYFFDEEKQRDSMRFEPQRGSSNPLSITHLAIEEASMLGLDLWTQLYDALPLGVQIIFIGDINQLPPVFGASILNYALVQLPVIELLEVYRQKGDSGILLNAHNILRGKGIEEGNGVTVIRGKSEQQVGQERMAQALGSMFKLWHADGSYRPEEDMILSPFNKQALGTDNMNKWIAQFLGEKRGAIVHEVLAGFNKHYLAVGDRVMVNKQDGYIVKISSNATYQGQEPQLAGSDLSRFGMRIIGFEGAQDSLDDVLLSYTNFDLDELAQQQAERKMQSSHIVEVLLESGQLVTLSATGDFGPQSFSLGYVLTVHKAQGCEFRKVFILLHKDHSVMLCRELFYTAVTRARDELVIIAKDWIIDKAIKNQKIKGDTLEDKIEYFNSGAVDLTGGVRCTK